MATRLITSAALQRQIFSQLECKGSTLSIAEWRRWTLLYLMRYGFLHLEVIFVSHSYCLYLFCHDEMFLLSGERNIDLGPRSDLVEESFRFSFLAMSSSRAFLQWKWKVWMYGTFAPYDFKRTLPPVLTHCGACYFFDVSVFITLERASAWQLVRDPCFLSSVPKRWCPHKRHTFELSTWSNFMQKVIGCFPSSP